MHFSTLQSGLFFIFLATATGLFGWLISDYLSPVFWAVVLTIVFYPLHTQIRAMTKYRESLASGITIFLILLVVVVPLYILASLIANETVNLYNWASQGNGSDAIIRISQVEEILKPIEVIGIKTEVLRSYAISLLQALGNQVGSYAVSVGRATASTIIATLLMLYILFFTLRDGVAIGKRIQKALPLGDAKERMLFDRFVAIVHAMFKGTFIIALIQGVIGGILFMAVGIHSAVLWAFVMAVLALIPAFGPAVVWLPAGLLLLATGSTWEGVAVLTIGVAVISVIDNLLRPVLVARDAAMPDVLILLSVLGGLTLFGVAGLIVGPIITAFFLSMWQLFEADYKEDLELRG